MQSNDRRNRLILQVMPALQRMSWRHAEKAGMPWQWRNDLAHDLVTKLCDVYERYEHLSDDELVATMIRSAVNAKMDACRHAAFVAPSAPVGGEALNYVTVECDGLRRVEIIDEIVALAKAAGWTLDELRVTVLSAGGYSLRDIAVVTGVPRSSLHRIHAQAMQKLGVLGQKHTPNRYTLSNPSQGDRHDA
jgi:DNA-directed RNA polymerase specialized sigma24 family protein